MALFNKLFSSRKKNCSKPSDTACEKTFVFTKEQVRVLLFRECDFRGRKLLFDSQSVQKVALNTSPTAQPTSQIHPSACNKNHEKYVEISSGYGYQYVKPCPDIGQLGEMVFGSIAMSYRGTSLKIHSLKSPSRLMCSQIFPSPRHPTKGCNSASSHSHGCSSVASCQSLEQSVRLDDSGTGSTNSISDRSSVQSTGSDTLLVCRGTRSMPLDVPASNCSVLNNNLASSVVGDSGFSGEQSYNSISSGPQSFPLCWTGQEGDQPFSSGSLYKRWLRSANTSLERSTCSLAGSNSTDECLLKQHSRSSKLGLAVVIELQADQEKSMEQFLMEHAALIESMVWRARQGAEAAYVRPNSFVSLMFDVATNTVHWVVDLLSGPQLANHMWLSLAPICDNFNSINTSVPNCNNNFRTVPSCNEEKGAKENGRTLTDSSSSVSLNNSFKSDSFGCSFDSSSDTLDKSGDFTFLNLTKFLRNEWALVSAKTNYSEKNVMAEKCVTELCELLECIDVKHTNFFVSTLLTAVLTHHLGWVATVLPPSINDKEKVSKLRNPCNPLWGQLSDLYGAIGHPTKIAHTIITGTNKSELISKILNSLTYFIRCSDTDRKFVTRLDIKEENGKVDCICQQKSCIPKANFKRYEDHLREMKVTSNSVSVQQCSQKQMNDVRDNEIPDNNNCRENVEMRSLNNLKTSKTPGLTKTRACLRNLNEIVEETRKPQQLYPNLEQLCKDENVKIDDVSETDDDNKPVRYDENANTHKLLDKVKSLGLQAVDSLPLDETKEYELTNAIINEKVRKLCRVPASAVLYHTQSDEAETQLIDVNEASVHIKNVFAPKKIDMEKQMKSVDHKSVDGTAIEHSRNGKSENVIFVLGDDEKLVDLKKSDNAPHQLSENAAKEENRNLPQKKTNPPRPTTLNLNDSKAKSSNRNNFFDNSQFKDADFSKYNNLADIKPSTSWTALQLCEKVVTNHSSMITLEPETGTNAECFEKAEQQAQKEFCRSQSVPPVNKNDHTETPSKAKYRYSGVKFNFQQYPQIVTNYMRIKNLELSHLPFTEKDMKLNSLVDYPEFNFLNQNADLEEVETLQTPSNASELEFTSDLAAEKHEVQHAEEKLEQPPKTFVRNRLPSTVIKEPNDVGCSGSFKKSGIYEHPLQIGDKSNNAMFEQEECNVAEKETAFCNNKMQIIELPMPKSELRPLDVAPISYSTSLIRGLGDHYISDMVLQGTSAPKSEWESTLRKDLSLATRHPFLDQPVDEATAIVANTDTWEVQLLSSHTYVVDRGSSGVRVGMSQLVANMLESLLQMWKVNTPPEYCIVHIEQRLQEFCILSKSLAELLLTTEFCSMELLTSVLQLEVNDVPLLMAVASTHSPQVTQKYGLSFQ